MLKTLASHKRRVKSADIVANRVLDTYLDKYGVTVDDLKADADRLWAYFNPSAEDTPEH